ncbi:MAG: hypothetical protein ACFFED_04220 [Candidatus Thorarchaeota archaeon]
MKLLEIMNYTDKVTKSFQSLLKEFNEQGDIGYCGFKNVYESLLPEQQKKLQKITEDRFSSYYQSGSFISIAITFKDPIIDLIDSPQNDEPNYETWNKYASEYDRINQVLNKIARALALQFEGIPLTATIGGVIEKVKHVSDYFPMVISHRAIAEQAGLGWRGKNQLIIHERYSCAIRFASVIVNLPLTYGSVAASKCGECTACEDVCKFIKNRDMLEDYRENCRRYILFLKSKGIEKDICGKCIKACYRSSIFHNQFSLG